MSMMRVANSLALNLASFCLPCLEKKHKKPNQRMGSEVVIQDVYDEGGKLPGTESSQLLSPLEGKKTQGTDL